MTLRSSQCRYLFVFLVGIIFNFHNSYAQLGWQWGIGSKQTDKVYDAYATAYDKFGNFFMAGKNYEGDSISLGAFTVHNPAHWDQLIISKTDSAGHAVWLLGSSRFAQIYALSADDSGNLFVYGSYHDTLGIGGITLNTNADTGFLIKISPSGSVLWGRNIFSQVTSCRMGSDGAGNIYVTGSFSDSLIVGGTTLMGSPSALYVFIEKYAPSGHLIWAKCFGGGSPNYAVTIAVARSGKFYISGAFMPLTTDTSTWHIHVGSTILTSSDGGYVTYLAKFDSSGSAMWAKKQIGLSAMVTDKTEQLYVSGSVNTSMILGTDTITNIGDADALFAKYDSSGHVVWARSAGGTERDQGYCIAIDNCDKVWIVGEMGNGNTIPYSYTMHFGSFSIAQFGGDNAFLACYDTLGNFVTAKSFASGGDDYIGLSVDNNGSVYVGGDYCLTPLIFGPDTLHAPVAISEYLFVAKYKYDTAGCKCAAIPVAAFTSFGSHVVTFNYTGTLPVDSVRWHFGDGTTSNTLNPVHTYSVSGSYTACITIYSGCSPDSSTYCKEIRVVTSVKSVASATHLYLFPNPATSSVTILSSEMISELIISNLIGQTLFAQKFNSEKVEVNVAYLPPGVYLVKINGTDVRKFVKE